MLFLWQFPLFMSIAWMYREDYDRAGYLVLPHGQTRASFVTLQTILPLLALLPVSVLPASAGRLSIFYCTRALLPSLGFFYCAPQLVLYTSTPAAPQLLPAPLIYPPPLSALI